MWFFHASFTPKIDGKVDITRKRLIVGSPDQFSWIWHVLAHKNCYCPNLFKNFYYFYFFYIVFRFFWRKQYITYLPYLNDSIYFTLPWITLLTSPYRLQFTLLTLPYLTLLTLPYLTLQPYLTTLPNPHLNLPYDLTLCVTPDDLIYPSRYLHMVSH